MRLISLIQTLAVAEYLNSRHAGMALGDAKTDTLERIFRRAVTELTKAGKIGSTGEWVWLVSGQPPDSGQ
jgi:hypothetical protein